MFGLKKKGEEFIASLKNRLFLEIFNLLLGTEKGRKTLLKKVEKQIKELILTKESSGIPYIRKVKYSFIVSLIKRSLKNIERGYFSKVYAKRVIDVMVKNLFLKMECGKTKREFEEKFGFYPPSFVTISPTQRCNLKCTGCYAASSGKTFASLPYNIVERIIKEMYEIAGSRFVVISGGEPFIWKDEGRGLLDIASEFNDVFFLVYTNSLLIGEGEARMMEKLGNITPAISVEGYEEETDRRRGKGVFRRIMEKMELLKKVGVPFGVSVTATRGNINLLLDERFYNYWFEEIGATYMWMFHLMPIGRAKDCMHLMITPEERKELFLLVERLLFEKEYFIGDFWNSGAASDGCIAYGRSGGYFYIDWNGNIMPCVFVPYYKDNIYDLYRNGKTVIDALMTDYFKRGRKWQSNYGFLKERPGSFLSPCSIRDHHEYFRRNILTEDIKPEDKNAKEALEDPEYFKLLKEFDEKLWSLTDPLWEERLKHRK